MKKRGWMKKLTVKELRHIKEMSGEITKRAAIVNAEHQNTMAFPCWECVSIGRKLGVDLPLTEFHKEQGGEI